MLGSKIETHHWPFPQKTEMLGQYATLEPFSVMHHADLGTATASSPESFTYLRYGPFETATALTDLLLDLSSRADRPFWAVLDRDGKARGWLSICDVSQTDGAFEIGSIWFAPSLLGTRAAHEAIFVLICLGMGTLDYERLVWRCQAQNAKSFKAAINLGFCHEGTWRHAAVVKAWQRDIAWFSIPRDEWPACRAAFVEWLLEANFDAAQKQKHRLQDLRA